MNDDPDKTMLAQREVPVWDLGVRFFHWALVLLVITSIVTSQIGGNAITYHVWSGYAILTLLIYRILWGVAGGTHARFANFIRGPGAVIAYMKGMFDRKQHGTSLGHNPMGALSVVAMLLVLLFQATSGLFVNDDIAFEGPLYRFVGKEVSDKLMSLHQLNKRVIIGLVALHLAAIAFHWFYHKENLVRPMITGVKRVAGAVGNSRHGNSLLALVLLGCSAAVVYFVVNAAKR